MTKTIISYEVISLKLFYDGAGVCKRKGPLDIN